jgi:hypothetical protein
MRLHSHCISNDDIDLILRQRNDNIITHTDCLPGIFRYIKMEQVVFSLRLVR